MVGSTRTEPATLSNLQRPAYRSGQRGPYSRPGVDSGSRNGSVAPVGVVPPVSQFLSLETYSLGEQKYTRYNEMRRALGTSLEEQHSFGSTTLQSKLLPPMVSEEVKRLRSSLQESSNKARDRKKKLDASYGKLDKYHNLKKQQRNDIPPNEKSAALGGQIHQNPLELGSQRLEERTKSGAPNKRARSISGVDAHSEGRSSATMRPGNVDKSLLYDNNNNMLRNCNGGASTPIEDKVCGLPAGGDGWERKPKKKRSVGIMVNRVSDGNRELNQPFQQRPNIDPRLRSCDGIGFRPGTSNAITGANKTGSSSQLTGASSHVIARNDTDNSSAPSDRREWSAVSNKERIVAKGSNKLNGREDAQVGNQSPLIKGKSSRPPRTGSGIVVNTNSSFPHSSGCVDGWEQASYQNKDQQLTGATNRKRSLPAGSSSTPVAQWAGQRPQTSSRTRRANIISPVSNFEEAHILSEGYRTDLGFKLTTEESSRLLLPKAMSNNPHQLKMKLDNVASPACISESEESGATDNKSKDKGSDNGDVEDVVRNEPTFGFPAKKKKVPLKDETANRRQGRSGRGSLQIKACLPAPKEKIENMNTSKPVKIGRPGSSGKTERVGRPPSKKASDRNTYIRPGQTTNNSPSELTGKSDDDREELLAAANAARNASYLACSSSFWKIMEPIFTFANPKDISYVKNQISFAEDLEDSLCNMPDADCNATGKLVHQSMLSTHSSFPIEQVNQLHVIGLHKYGGAVSAVDETRSVNASSGKVETRSCFEKIVPLSQRLLSAFIAEDGTEALDSINEHGDVFSHFSNDRSPNRLNNRVENDPETELEKSVFELDPHFKHKKSYSSDNIPCSGHTGSSNLRSPNIQNFISVDVPSEGNNVLANSDTGNLSECAQTNLNPLNLPSTGFSSGSPSECQFEHMSLDDRILMELQSIGLLSETVPDLSEGDDEEIDKVISELKMRLYHQVGKNKNQLIKLEKAIQVGKEIEERNFEQLAMNKLVETAYKKLTGGRGSHGSSHKSGASKAGKQHALAFAKRTLTRCRKFEETGRSCFNDPTCHDIVFSAPLYNNSSKHIDGISPGTAANMYVDSRGCQPGSQALGSGAPATGATSISEKPGLGHKLDTRQLDQVHGLSYLSEQTITKNDQISNRGRKREVLLDDVVTGAASRATSTLNHDSPSGAKWKKSVKYSQNKDTVTKTSAKAGRPSVSNGRAERKTKPKPKQKIAQLSTSGNGLGRVTKTSIPLLQSMGESSATLNSGGTGVNHKANSTCTLRKDLSIEDSIFPNLPLHGIESIAEFDEADGLCGQGQDISSWLNVDEDALQDNDLVGLEIPMDDLSDLKLNF